MDYSTYREALGSTLAGSEVAFPAPELEARQASARRAMAERGVDTLLVTAPAEIFYLTGYSTFEVSVHACLVLGRDRVLLQVPSIETGPAVVCTRVASITGYRWEDTGGPLHPLIEALRDSGTVGFDPWQPGLRPGLLDALRTALPDCRFVDASDLLPPLRRVKSSAELAYLQASAGITRIGLDAAEAAITAGAADSDVAGAAAAAMHGAGSEFMSMQPIVTTGVRSSVIHANHRGRRIADGDPVFVELGASVARYTAPMMRTTVCGTPTAAMRRVHDGCRRIFDVLVDHMRPGATFDDAARAAEAALAPLAREAFFSGVFGYTVGASFPPSWVEGTGFIARGADARFQENMVFHLPLCLRLPGAWGIGVSETVRVTADGPAEPLTDNIWDLRSR